MPEITTKGYACTRCAWSWTPRRDTDRPTICPKCKSKLWDVAREQRKDTRQDSRAS